MHVATLGFGQTFDCFDFDVLHFGGICVYDHSHVSIVLPQREMCTCLGRNGVMKNAIAVGLLVCLSHVVLDAVHEPAYLAIHPDRLDSLSPPKAGEAARNLPGHLSIQVCSSTIRVKYTKRPLFFLHLPSERLKGNSIILMVNAQAF